MKREQLKWFEMTNVQLYMATQPLFLITLSTNHMQRNIWPHLKKDHKCARCYHLNHAQNAMTKVQTPGETTRIDVRVCWDQRIHATNVTCASQTTPTHNRAQQRCHTQRNTSPLNCERNSWNRRKRLPIAQPWNSQEKANGKINHLNSDGELTSEDALKEIQLQIDGFLAY